MPLTAAVAMLGMSVANAGTESDVLSVSLAGGPPAVFVIPEGGTAGGMEPGAVFNPMAGFDPTSLDIPFALAMGAHFVFLTEPSGVAAEAGEIGISIPCPVQPGQCILSDIVVGFQDATGPHVGFYSDPHSVFLDPSLPSLFPLATILEETGTMQDVTAALGFPVAAMQVGVMSDVVPIPAAGWLFASGLGLLGLSRRRSN